MNSLFFFKNRINPQSRSRSKSTILFFLLSLIFPAAKAEFEPGESYFGRNGYVEYIAGNLPIILVTGHDGRLQPEEIPDRTYGVVGRDSSSQPLTLAMMRELRRRTGKFPHVIINHLHRKKLDPNRAIEEAAQGSEHAEQAWREFHGYIETARETSAEEFGFGFLFDIHGHAHDIKRLELGYALGPAQLNLSDERLNMPGYGWNSSIRTLVARRPEISFSELIRGPQSLGSLFNFREIPAWPSAQFPKPFSNPFFSGGYITRHHTSFTDTGPINGVQIETPYPGVRDSEFNRNRFAYQFGVIMQPFLFYNFGYSLGSAPHYTIETETGEIESGGDPIQIEIRRDGFLYYPDEIDIAFEGNARPDIDFSIDTTTVDFRANESRTTLLLTPLSPPDLTEDRIIELRLSPRIDQSADLTPVRIILRDNNQERIHFAADDFSISENAGKISIPLKRRSAEEDFSIALDWSGSAISADFDLFSKLPKKAFFAAGEMETEISFSILDNGIFEPDRTIELKLIGADQQLGHPDKLTITIEDDDHPHALALWLNGETDGAFYKDRSGNDHHAAVLNAGNGPETGDSSDSTMKFENEIVVAVPPTGFDPSNGFTFAFHFKPDPYISLKNRTLLDLGTRGAEGSLSLFFENDSTLRTQFGTEIAVALDAAQEWQDQNWHHYALSVEPNGRKTVYIDGIPVRTRSSGSAELDSNQFIWLGWKPGSADTGNFFKGEIDDFRIYERPLKTAEIESIALGKMNFSAWAASLGLAEDVDPNESPNRDGRTLFEMYAFGADPKNLAQFPRPFLETNDGNFSLFQFRRPDTSDVRWRIESTENLGQNWQSVAESEPGDSTWQTGPGISIEERENLIELRDSEAIESRSRFYRIKAEFEP